MLCLLPLLLAEVQLSLMEETGCIRITSSTMMVIHESRRIVEGSILVAPRGTLEAELLIRSGLLVLLLDSL